MSSPMMTAREALEFYARQHQSVSLATGHDYGKRALEALAALSQDHSPRAGVGAQASEFEAELPSVVGKSAPIVSIPLDHPEAGAPSREAIDDLMRRLNKAGAGRSMHEHDATSLFSEAADMIVLLSACAPIEENIVQVGISLAAQEKPSRALNTDSLTKFTPGPWVIIPAREYDGDDDDLVGSYTSPAGIEGSDGNPVCVFGTCEGSGALFENEADYHLIRTAPELYEALVETRKDLSILQGNVADAATRDHRWEGMAGVVRGWINRNDTALAKARGESTPSEGRLSLIGAREVQRSGTTEPKTPPNGEGEMGEAEGAALVSAWWSGVRAGQSATGPSDERALAAAKAFLSSLKEPTCQTCDGRGEIGGFDRGDNAWRTEPCPDCALKEPSEHKAEGGEA